MRIKRFSNGAVSAEEHCHFRFLTSEVAEELESDLTPKAMTEVVADPAAFALNAAKGRLVSLSRLPKKPSKDAPQNPILPERNS